MGARAAIPSASLRVAARGHPVDNLGQVRSTNDPALTPPPLQPLVVPADVSQVNSVLHDGMMIILHIPASNTLLLLLRVLPVVPLPTFGVRLAALRQPESGAGIGGPPPHPPLSDPPPPLPVVANPFPSLAIVLQMLQAEHAGSAPHLAFRNLSVPSRRPEAANV